MEDYSDISSCLSEIYGLDKEIEYRHAGEYLFEEFDNQESLYYEELAFLHKEHIELYDAGILGSLIFWQQTSDDLYYNNVDAQTWFYDGTYPFDNLEDDLD